MKHTFSLSRTHTTIYIKIYVCLPPHPSHFLWYRVHSLLCHLTTSQTQHDTRFYELRISIPSSYPATPPRVRFVSKINMNCVNSKTGEVIYAKLPATKNWNRNMGIEQVLISLRAEMTSSENRRLKQPSEGSTF